MKKILVGVVLNACVTAAACHYMFKVINSIDDRYDHNVSLMFSEFERLKHETRHIEDHFGFIENRMVPVLDDTNEKVSRLEFYQRLDDVRGITGGSKIIDSCISQKRTKETPADFMNPSWYYDSVMKCINDKMKALLKK